MDKRKIERFFASDLYKTFMAENKVRREFKFSVLVPAQAYFPVAADAPEENVLLQGVIDCLIETRDGFVILDFKTDRIKKGGAVERAEQYRPQLAAYARACMRFTADRSAPACCTFSTPAILNGCRLTRADGI